MRREEEKEDEQRQHNNEVKAVQSIERVVYVTFIVSSMTGCLAERNKTRW
jgi:hypothetical protein